MNQPLAQLKDTLKEMTRLYGATHWVFIAPFDLPTCMKMRAMESNVMEGVPLPDTFLSSRKDLDIYFIDKAKHRRAFRDGEPVFFNRLSLGGPKDGGIPY